MQPESGAVTVNHFLTTVNLSKFVSLACCCKMQAHSTMMGKRRKIIDVDLLSDASSPTCYPPQSPIIKEEELDYMEEMQVEAEVEEDVMGLSDAESDEVEKAEEALNVSFSDDIGDLGYSEGEEEAAKEEGPLPLIKVGDSFGTTLCKKDIMAEVLFCFDPIFNALLALSQHVTHYLHIRSTEEWTMTWSPAPPKKELYLYVQCCYGRN